MKYKYGIYPDIQFAEYKQKIHCLIHWLLIYAEDRSDCLPGYFVTVQTKLNGMNELLNYPEQVIEIMNLVECARLEYEKPDFSFPNYRHLILDAHSLIDKIGGEQDE